MQPHETVWGILTVLHPPHKKHGTKVEGEKRIDMEIVMHKLTFNHFCLLMFCRCFVFL